MRQFLQQQAPPASRYRLPLSTERLICAFLLGSEREDAMNRDLLAISAGILAIGAVIWAFWGNPEKVRHRVEALNADADLKLVSQRSAYMRDER
jgi:hypothetical protein